MNNHSVSSFDTQSSSSTSNSLFSNLRHTRETHRRGRSENTLSFKDGASHSRSRSSSPLKSLNTFSSPVNWKSQNSSVSSFTSNDNQAGNEDFNYITRQPNLSLLEVYPTSIIMNMMNTPPPPPPTDFIMIDGFPYPTKIVFPKKIANRNNNEVASESSVPKSILKKPESTNSTFVSHGLNHQNQQSPVEETFYAPNVPDDKPKESFSFPSKPSAPASASASATSSPSSSSKQSFERKHKKSRSLGAISKLAQSSFSLKDQNPVVDRNETSKGEINVSRPTELTSEMPQLKNPISATTNLSNVPVEKKKPLINTNTKESTKAFQDQDTLSNLNTNYKPPPLPKSFQAIHSKKGVRQTSYQYAPLSVYFNYMEEQRQVSLLTQIPNIDKL